MKRIVLLLSLLLSERLVFAQESFQMARPAGTPQISGTPGVSTKAAVDKYGNQQVVLVAPGGTGASPVKAEDSVAASGDALVGVAGVINTGFSAPAASGDYAALALGQFGQPMTSVLYDSAIPAGLNASAQEDLASATGDAGIKVLTKILAVPVSQAADADYSIPLMNDLNATYVDSVRRATWNHSNPSINTATSTTLVAANASRKMVIIQNNSAANICISFNAATLTGIVPSNTNPCIVLAAGLTYVSPPNACPTNTITVYQASGGTISTISTIEQS